MRLRSYRNWGVSAIPIINIQSLVPREFISSMKKKNSIWLLGNAFPTPTIPNSFVPWSQGPPVFGPVPGNETRVVPFLGDPRHFGNALVASLVALAHRDLHCAAIYGYRDKKALPARPRGRRGWRLRRRHHRHHPRPTRGERMDARRRPRVHIPGWERTKGERRSRRREERRGRAQGSGVGGKDSCHCQWVIRSVGQWDDHFQFQSF